MLIYLNASRIPPGRPVWLTSPWGKALASYLCSKSVPGSDSWNLREALESLSMASKDIVGRILVPWASGRLLGGRWTPRRARSAKTQCVSPLWVNFCPTDAPLEAPRWPPEGPRWPQDGPERLQDDPKWPQDGPKRAQDGPNNTQDAPGSKVAPHFWPTWTPKEASRSSSIWTRGTPQK